MAWTGFGLAYGCSRLFFYPPSDCTSLLCSGLTNLNRLDLAYVKVSPGSIAQLAPLVQLQELVVYGDFLGLATAVRSERSKERTKKLRSPMACQNCV
jgi:hypothetical protein